MKVGTRLGLNLLIRGQHQPRNQRSNGLVLRDEITALPVDATERRNGRRLACLVD